jgi:Velvet factor
MYFTFSSFYAVATLVNPVSLDPIEMIVSGDQVWHTPLIGERVVSLQKVSWHAGEISTNRWVFPFGDLSVRRDGVYRLQFDAFEIANTDVKFTVSRFMCTPERIFVKPSMPTKPTLGPV